MSTIVAQAFITLDGVVQGGGAPDEDREGGFKHGGWAMDYDDRMDQLNEGGEIVREWESRTEALLLAALSATLPRNCQLWRRVSPALFRLLS
jgi:hypothetical protein